MNKSRRPGANWFTLPPSERQALMTEHGRTGMRYGGRVTQLITVSVGLDDWEWGVTLWASNPEYLKDIVDDLEEEDNEDDDDSDDDWMDCTNMRTVRRMKRGAMTASLDDGEDDMYASKHI